MTALAGLIAPAYSIDEGVAKGSLNLEGRAIALSHSYAHQHDNGEGLLDGPQLRVLLTDRKIDHTLLGGLHTTRLDVLARQGGVQGVLLTADSREPAAAVRAMLLTAQAEAEKPHRSFVVRGADQTFRELHIGNNRVVGEVRHDSKGAPAFSYAATFSAPLFQEEPISGRYSGPAAAESDPYKTLAAYAKALGAGEHDAARRLATAASFREVDALIARVGRSAALRMFRNMSGMLGAKEGLQVFVRSRRALVVFQAGKSRGTQALVRADGKWLVD